MTPRMFYTLARVLAALTVIPFHEAGHALAAWLLGDPTAKQQGRLSLNPFRHFDLLGTLCMVFAGLEAALLLGTRQRSDDFFGALPAILSVHGREPRGVQPHPRAPAGRQPGAAGGAARAHLLRDDEV